MSNNLDKFALLSVGVLISLTRTVDVSKLQEKTITKNERCIKFALKSFTSRVHICREIETFLVYRWAIISSNLTHNSANNYKI